MSAVCASSIELVPGVSTRCSPRSQLLGMSSTSTSLCACDGSKGTAGCLISVIEAVVGSTPSPQWLPPRSAFNRALFPALNSPKTQQRKSESSTVIDSRSVVVSASDASILTSVCSSSWSALLCRARSACSAGARSMDSRRPTPGDSMARLVPRAARPHSAPFSIALRWRGCRV